MHLDEKVIFCLILNKPLLVGEDSEASSDEKTTYPSRIYLNASISLEGTYSWYCLSRHLPYQAPYTNDAILCISFEHAKKSFLEYAELNLLVTTHLVESSELMQCHREQSLN